MHYMPFIIANPLYTAYREEMQFVEFRGIKLDTTVNKSSLVIHCKVYL